MKAAHILLLLVACGFGCPLSEGQNAANQHTPGRVATTTRMVSIFSELENHWFQAVQHKDGSAMNQLLSEDFQMWTPKNKGPLPREGWQQEEMGRAVTAFHFRQMAVRALHEETAVVSFVLNQSVQSEGKSAEEDYFVVDIWSKQDDHWVCTDRYSSPLTTGRVAADLKPSGRR